MAELHEEYAKKLVTIFLQEYNKRNKTSYSWIEGKSYQPKNKTYFDFIVFDGIKELGIQHTFAVADPEREFARPNATRKVIDALKTRLQNNPRVPSIFISLNFHNPPRKTADTEEAIYWLDMFITEKVSNPISLNYYSYDSSFDDQFLPQIKKFVDDIQIKPLLSPREEKNISLGYSWSKQPAEPWMNDFGRVKLAIDKKEKECADILLLIEVGIPTADFYLKEMKEYAKTKNMKEIWIVEPYLGREKAIKIK